MISADTSSISAFLRGESGADVERLAEALVSRKLAIAPVVLTEILTDPFAGPALDEAAPELLLLEIVEGYWRRAGEMRRLIKSKKLRAKIADSLIAQSCIDHDVALISRDADFRHFAEHCGLKLA